MNDVTWTPEADARLRRYLSRPGYEIPSGLGTEDAACSMAAINLALNGKLTDGIPDCMSMVIGRWVIVVQDEMPDYIRNGSEWKRLLPLAAATGHAREHRRLDIVLSWLLDHVLPLAHPYALSIGAGDRWLAMLQARTSASCDAAALALSHDYGPLSSAAHHAGLALSSSRTGRFGDAATRAAGSAIRVLCWTGKWDKLNPAETLHTLIHMKGRYA